MALPDSKVCAACGREITWRKKWERNWPAVKYCGEACRRHKHSKVDQQLEDAILELLSERNAEATICPSEAARAIGGERWRDLMQPARSAARRLVDRGKIVITQQGRIVDPSSAKGPIRLRKV